MEGRLSTVPCARPYRAGGSGSLLSAVFGVVYHRGGDSSLQSPVFGFTSLVWLLGERTVADTLPPVGRVEVE